MIKSIRSFKKENSHVTVVVEGGEKEFEYVAAVIRDAARKSKRKTSRRLSYEIIRSSMRRNDQGME